MTQALLHRLAVTGMGAVSAVGAGCSALRQALDTGRDGISEITRFSTDALTVHLGGMVPGTGSPFQGEALAPTDSRGLCVDFALQAGREAWVDARLDRAGLRPERIALVLGTSIGGQVDELHGITDEVAARLGVGGPRLTVSTACSSSAGALDLARCLLHAGQADVVLAGGADVLTLEVLAGFHALGLLAKDKCAPFSQPFGTTLGEGAGLLVLETQEHARRRRVAARAVLAGSAMAADAYHATTPDPAGGGVARALRAALDDAGLTADDVGYVNAHGTGTQANDTAEWKAIQTVFGARAAVLPISATKSFLGHAQGAAGVLELIATILCMERATVPPTLRHLLPRPFSPPDAVSGTCPRPLAYEHAACISSAFGGANAVVIASRGSWQDLVERERRPVYLVGAGAFAGTTTPIKGDEQRTGASCATASLSDLDLRAMLPRLDPRGLDPASRFLISAAARALVDAGITVRGTLRERAGIFVGAVGSSAESSSEFRRSIEERGLAQLSATAFTRLVLNAAAGVCCQALNLRAATTTVSIDAGSGLLALIYAVETLAMKRSVDLLLAAAFDEPNSAALTVGRTPAAACIALSAPPMTLEPHPARAVRAAGWSIGAPGEFSTTVKAALDRAGMSIADVDTVSGYGAARTTWPALQTTGPDWHGPGATATASMLSATAAFEALRAGRSRVTLIGSGGGASASLALILCADHESPTGADDHE